MGKNYKVAKQVSDDYGFLDGESMEKIFDWLTDEVGLRKKCAEKFIRGYVDDGFKHEGAEEFASAIFGR